MTSSLTTDKVRELNDRFRTSVSSPLGTWFMTSGVTAEGPDFVALCIGHVMGFDAFTEDNDPYGEHDFGSVKIAGETVFWKIDYYNPNLDGGSDDPADTTKTHRVLTVMLASEY